MPKFNTAPALSANNAAEQLSREANLSYDEMLKAQAAAIDLIRKFNNLLAASKEKFLAAGAAWRNASGLSSDLATNTSSFPEPIPEPTTTEPVPPIDGAGTMLVRGVRVG